MATRTVNTGPLLADSDVLSFTFKANDLGKKYEPRIIAGKVFVSFITVAELEVWAGIRNWSPARAERLRAWLGQFEVIWPDQALCTEWAAVTLEGRLSGRNVPPNDAWIAASARLYDLPLLTHNKADFLSIKGLTLKDVD